MALTFAGREEEAMITANGLAESPEITRNPHALVGSMLACGVAFRRADPVRARDALRRGLKVAQDSGCRTTELAMNLAVVEGALGDTASAFDHVNLAIRNYHDSGGTTMIRGVLGVVAALFDRLGRSEAAAIVAGFASLGPGIALFLPEITTTIAQLRAALGDETYESVARTGKNMTTAEMVAYAYDQIDQARSELEQLP